MPGLRRWRGPEIQGHPQLHIKFNKFKRVGILVSFPVALKNMFRYSGSQWPHQQPELKCAGHQEAMPNCRVWYDYQESLDADVQTIAASGQLEGISPQTLQKSHSGFQSITKRRQFLSLWKLFRQAVLQVLLQISRLSSSESSRCDPGVTSSSCPGHHPLSKFWLFRLSPKMAPRLHAAM